MKKIIGILGGIGPESSADFYMRLINELQKRKLVRANEDYPHIIINSIPAKELVNHNDLEKYVEGIKALENAGADFVVIICNTAYLYLKELQEEVNTPILNLKEELNKKLDNLKKSRNLILASKKIINSNLFSINHIKIEERDKDKLDKIILEYNLGKNKLQQKSIILRLIKKYKPVITIFACTEISTLLKGVKIKKIDTLDIILEATIERWLNSF